MAIILTMDRANIRGKKRPRIRAVTVDGYVLYSEQRDGDKVRVQASANIQDASVTALGIAREMCRIGIGERVYHELREELARLAKEERKRARSGNDGRATGGAADDRGAGAAGG